MNINEIHRDDIGLYRKLISGSQKQLASIHVRLKGNTGKVENFWFWNRNRRIKEFILAMLDRKEIRIGEDALREMIDDLKRIESNQKDWPGVGKDELDYIQIMLHGLRDMSQFESRD